MKKCFNVIEKYKKPCYEEEKVNFHLNKIQTMHADVLPMLTFVMQVILYHLMMHLPTCPVRNLGCCSHHPMSHPQLSLVEERKGIQEMCLKWVETEVEVAMVVVMVMVEVVVVAITMPMVKLLII